MSLRSYISYLNVTPVVTVGAGARFAVWKSQIAFIGWRGSSSGEGAEGGGWWCSRKWSGAATGGWLSVRSRVIDRNPTREKSTDGENHRRGVDFYYYYYYLKGRSLSSGLPCPCPGSVARKRRRCPVCDVGETRKIEAKRNGARISSGGGRGRGVEVAIIENMVPGRAG